MSESPTYGARHLEVYQLAHKLAVSIHKMSMRLPSHELFEEGQQIRKSSKSAAAQIVEGYRLRKYRDEYLHYLHRAAGSADETHEHLDLLYETRSLKDLLLYSTLKSQSDQLLSKLTRFIVGVERSHSKPFYLR
jgi:four helix bundle protein